MEEQKIVCNQLVYLVLSQTYNNCIYTVILNEQISFIYIQREITLTRLWNICVTNVPLVVSTSRPFPRSRLIIGFITKLTRRVPLVKQELLTIPEHLSSPPGLVGFVLHNLVLCVHFVDSYLSFCTFSFGHCVVRSSSNSSNTKYERAESLDYFINQINFTVES